MIDQLPKIPDDDTPVEVIQKTQEKVTLNDLPPPGAILQRPLTDREVLALKAFGSDTLNFLNEISKDMLPGIGEARAVEYTNQEVEALKKAVEDRDVPGTIVHGVGVPIMSAGTLPYWLGGGIIGGAAAFVMRDIIGKGYRNMTRKFRAPETARGAEAPSAEVVEAAQVQGKKEADRKANVTLSQKDVPIKITERYNYGETGTPNRFGLAETVSEFQGSRAFDEISQLNFKNTPSEQIVGTIIGKIRQGKINKDELFDAGILKLDAKMKPIGGALYDLLQIKGATVSKQDILKMLKDSPSNRLKVKHYGSQDFNKSEFFDLYASTDIMAANLRGNLNETIFKTTNTADRTTLRNVEQTIADLQSAYDRTAMNGSVIANFASNRKLNSLRDIIPSLSVGDQQIMRAFISNLEKMRKYVSPQKGGFKGSAKHESVGSTKGGDNYRETVIHLDENIPRNQSGKYVNPGHFPEVNPVVFTLKKTRYNQKGDPILFAEEIQSDPIQKFFGEGQGDLRKLISNPYGKSLVETFIKRRMKDASDQQKPLINKVKREPLTKAEMKLLNDLDAEKALYRKFFQRSEILDESGLQQLSTIMKKNIGEQPDYFPYLNQYYKLAIREMIDDAIRTGKKGISILPTTTYKGKSTHHKKDAGHYLYYGDEKGLKTKAFDQAQLPGPGTRKKAGDAIYIETMKKIAKEIEQDYGLKLPISKQKIYSNTFKGDGPYAIRNPNGSIMATFKKKTNRDYVLNKLNSKRSSSDKLQADLLAKEDFTTDEMFTSIVMEIPENAAKILNKKKMRSYATGGLVAIVPKREYFAPIF
tara:strand:- start:559 stop:3000 length:2442 start_codon:yes stop_codon:yes gene_type:complete